MIRVFDMFAGYGGAEFALKKAGIEHECVGFSEIDKYAIQCFEQNHYNVMPYRNGDKKEIGESKNYGDCRNIIAEELPDFDLLTGGFPCQSFSVAGKGLGELDARGTLFYEIVRIAEVKQPKYMLLENVKGLTFKTHKATFDKILSELDRVGYRVHWKVLNTKDFGIPQNRERVFFACIRKDIDQEFEFPKPTDKKLTLRDILLDEVDKKYYLTASQLNTLMRKFGSKGKCLDGKTEADTITTSMGTGGGNVPFVTNSSPREVGFREDCPALCARDYKEPKVIQYRMGHTKSEYAENVYESEVTRTIETSGNLAVINPFNGKTSAEETGTIGTSVGTTTGKTAQILIDPRQFKGENEPRTYEESPTLLARARTDEVPLISTSQKEPSVKVDGISPTLRAGMGTGGGHIPIIKGGFRKLTPKECFRLMGFVNDEINLQGLSDTQQYKLAGNGWDINLVSLIFKNLIPNESE